MKLSVLVAVLFVSVLTLDWAQAQSDMTAEKADVRVIIDISGSMKQNDPDNLRRPALDLLVKLIPEGSRAGVWTFGQYVNMLVPLKEVDSAWRQEAAKKVEEVNSVGLYTNIGGALERAAKDGGKPQAGYRTSIILLTDGMVDISREPEDNAKEWRRIVDKVLPSLKGERYKIHTVALSANADTELMNALSLGTDGIVAVADSAEQLPKIFLRMLEQSAPADEVPLSENKFLVDSSIEEFTALIFRAVPEQQAQLLSPDKKYYQADTKDKYVTWYRAADHDLITIKHPIEGEWLVRADLDPESKITIVTDLKLLVKPMANNLFEGEAAVLQFLLQDNGKTLSDARFLRLLNIQAELLLGEKLIWSEKISDQLPPGDGIYRRNINQFAGEGNYQLRVQIDGKSFSREISHRFAVRAPFAVELLSPSSGERLVRVRANGQSLDRSKTVVVAKVKEPSGRSSIQPLQLTQSDSWELLLAPDQDGTYVIDLRVSAVDTNNQSFDHNPESLRFSYPDGADPFVASEAAAVTPQVIAPEPAPDSADLVAVVPEDVSEEVPEAAVDDTPKAESTNWLLYGALGFGNLLILALAYFAYRTLMGGKKVAPEDLEIEEDLDTPAPNADASPPLEDLGGDDESMADDLMAPLDEDSDQGMAAIDIESDSAADALADADDTPEFSLDDLAPSKDDDETK
ncbi:hypothetical protein R50072_10860 [Simiduia litorea]|uniref:VWA domain-containing protein n=1 Tax=Simiduia litorea TaxID=1435348 RepID=UPI0036F1B9B7